MTTHASTNIHWHEGDITREERWRALKAKGATLWFTGLSGSGKSTIASALEQVLVSRGVHCYRLDGDNVRFGLNAGPKILAENFGFAEAPAKRFGLGFSAEDRAENIRRIGEVAKLFTDAGVIALTAFISPYRADRDKNRALRAIYEKLRTEGDANLHYIPATNLLGLDGEGTVDGTHPTDVGFLRMAGEIGPAVARLLKAR